MDAGTRVTVMTRNVFLGAEFDEIIVAPSVADIPARVGAFWRAVQAADYPSRAKLVADEVAAVQPDILAAQELELFRMQTPSNFDVSAPVIDAETVAPAGDLLAILQAELMARGLDYGDPVVVVAHTDAEMPGIDEAGTTFDLRLTDRDAIFVRQGLTVTNPRGADFSTFIAVSLGGSTGGIPVKLKRGYAIVDVNAGGTPFTFVSTHLEVGGRAALFQEAQARELITALAGITGSVILAGDFNSAAAGTTSRSYATLTTVFTDAWAKVNANDPGFTCCSAIAADPAPTERIDLVLFRGSVSALSAARVGLTARTPGGLSASDHQGVWATLSLRP
jgi:endonuclease/exonuclease/phosphatase family metal-dependent hydrolase